MKSKQKSFQSFFTRASFAGLWLVAGAAAAQAQTNGTLTGTAVSYNYSTAPFVITSGPGTYPDGGGTLTLNPITAPTPGNYSSFTTVTMDVSPTLSQIVVNSPLYYNLAAGSGTSIIAANTGLTINTQSTAQIVSTSIAPLGIPIGFEITSPISGGGTTGLTKTGSGVLYVASASASTYTGGTHFNGGIVSFNTSAAVGDAGFGAAGAGNGLSFNGGSVLFATTGGLTSARDIFIDTGGATLLTSTATTLSGVISGTGTLNNVGFSGPALTLTGASTFTGATVARGSNVITTLSGTGSINASSSYDLMGTFNLTNTGTNVTNRLSDTAPVTLRGLNFVSTGNATAASSETVGAVTAANSFNTFLVTPGTTAANSLTMASLARQNNSTLDFRGTGLGGTPGNTVANIYVTAAPTLVGGGGGAGTTGISIIPYAIGNNTNSVLFTPAGQVGSSFVTNDINGIRPLATSEYATAFGGNATDNVRITAVTAAPVATVNALLVAPSVASTAAAPVLTGGTINVTSGAVLYSPTTNVAGFIGANLDFGAAEGVVTGTSALTLSGVIAGSNGLTLTSLPATSFTSSITLTGANTYTGNTTLNGGSLGISGTIANGTAGPLGTNGTLILDGGINLASLVFTGATTFNRDISVIGLGQDYIAANTGNITATFNGNVSLSNNLNVSGNGVAAASAITFNGTISGPGSIRDISASYGVFNGNNTYSGGTFLATSTYYAGSDTAFGTGLITINSVATLAGVGTAARTLANPILINAVNATFGGTAPLTFTGGVSLNGAATITTSNTALTTFGGVVSNGGLTKGGTGAVAFNSPTGNTYTDGFINTGLAATASAIYANNTSGSAFGTGAVSIGAASATVYSTLAGNFTTSGATRIAGQLSPGNTPANLTAATAGQGAIGTAAFNTTLTLSSATTSSLYLEAASNVSRDQITVGGLFTLNGTVYIATTNGFSFTSGTVIDFVDWGSISAGTVTFNTTGAAVAPGYALDTSMFTTDGTIRVTAVPEPGTLGIFGAAGVLGIFGWLRRRPSRA